MTIVFTGGGTGGHFYPIIAMAEAIRDLSREQHLIEPEMYFFAPAPLDENALFENGIAYVHIPAGKLRRYPSVFNVSGLFTTFFGIFPALANLFRIYPDVVVSKGGYGSVPNVIAARILRIPVIIHESDAKPGRANLMASKFAKKIAISYESAAHYFPKKAQSKIARTGIPVRKELMRTEQEGALQLLGLEPLVPTILIMGGSQGSERINDAVLSALPDLVSIGNIIHQTGQANAKSALALSGVVLDKNPNQSRYHALDFLSVTALQRAAGAANLIVSRAGSSSITEISLWEKPSIIIPIPESVSHDQRTNAYAYARTGAAIVIEEENLTPHLLVAEIQHILGDPELQKKMVAAAATFAEPDAARIIAKEILSIGISHEV